MKDVWRLDDYQQIFEDQLASALEGHDESTIDVEELVSSAFRETLQRTANALYVAFEERAAAMLKEHRSLRRAFVSRNMNRWRGGFDSLERLIVISQETGDAINNTLRSKAAEENDALFEAVISNHARAIQVSREILALMIAGFPDGAMGRWRTLHEIATVAMFLSQAGKETAERYILHDHVTSYKRAINYMQHHKRANLGPIEPAVIEELKAAHDEIISTRGESMKYDYGWAATALNKAKPTFADLEIATGLDHWRPRYKWATVNTHGAYRAPNSTLATCEAEQPVLAVGESNSGMTDPGHMTAISLNLATLPVIRLEPNLDRLAIALVMHRLSDEVGETFWRLDQETLERERKRREAAAHPRKRPNPRRRH